MLRLRVWRFCTEGRKSLRGFDSIDGAGVGTSLGRLLAFSPNFVVLVGVKSYWIIGGRCGQVALAAVSSPRRFLRGTEDKTGIGAAGSEWLEAGNLKALRIAFRRRCSSPFPSPFQFA